MLKDSIRKKLENHKVISFDVYDTLIKRNVKRPEDVFKLVERQFAIREGKEISEFQEKRCEAYYNAYKKYGAMCTIEHIYENLRNVDKEDAEKFYNIKLHDIEDLNNLDCLIIAVAHKEFKELSVDVIDKMFKDVPVKNKVIVDIKGIQDRKKMTSIGYKYWRL